ncbi:hypothetical protein HIM_12118 [Hirsutella minnesotensis 3608]|uniref:Uncharacterized protein n=1 Tax=Hirsutella minnesotensis 3608 TaxID=1043627 RepID=A0A0F7ZW77_9HYPO|nr:hypothetical protein HIM_12118 [Hirsutella minnesotensis 3608]
MTHMLLSQRPTPKRLDLPRRSYTAPRYIKGIDGRAQCITSSIQADFQLQGRTFRDQPILEADLGTRNDFHLIVGLMFLSHFDIRLDCRRRRLIFPPELEAQRDWIPDIALKASRLMYPKPVSLRVQADVERRDHLWEEAERQDQEEDGAAHIIQISPAIQEPTGATSTIGPRQHRPRYSTHRGDDLGKMNRALAGIEWRDPCQKDIRPRYQRRAQDLDILMISAPAFHAGIRRRKDHRHAYEDVTFLNLHMIDKALGERGEQDNQQDEDDRFLAEKLPPELADLADVFSREDSNRMPPSRPGVDHKIELTGPAALRTHPLYSLNREQLETMKEYLQDSLQKGFIEPSSAQFGSPVCFAKKKDGKLRFCVDFRELNQLTKKDRYPIPLISETLDRIAKAKIFTKLDIRQAFHRIRLEPDSVELTAFRTRYGQFHYKVLPFGLCNRPSTFQRFINTTLWDYLDSFCTAYLDDILVFSEDKKEHMRHVRLVLERLREAGLQVDIKKCEFGVTKTDFLGFIISTDGISVDPRKVSAILTWQTPRCKKELQSFLGFCNFYRRFIRNYGRICRPLNRLTGESRWDFDDRCLEAFETLKTALTTAPVLVHFIEDRETKLETDASDGVIAGVLSQLADDGQWHPVSFLTKTMNAAECNYEIHDKELLAIIVCLKEWMPLVSLVAPGVIKIFTDHQALQYFATKRMLNARQARWIETLAMAQDVQLQKALKELNRSQILIPATQFAGGTTGGAAIAAGAAGGDDPTIAIYTPGSARQAETPNSRDGCLLEGFELIEAILQANRASPSLRSEREQAEIPDSRFQVQSGLLCYDGRLVVPDEANLRTALCHEAHRPRSQAHPGRNKMRKILTRRYYWLGIGGFIDRYCANCADCKRSQDSRLRPAGLLQPLPIPERPWQHISMDFKTMPRDKKGYTAVFVTVCRLSKRTFSLPTYTTCTAQDMAWLFYEHIWRTYGAPETITSDRGPQFISSFWNELCRLVGTKMKLSTAEHPQTDGQTEIINQFLQTKLRPYLDYYQDNWSEMLPCLDFAHSTHPHESIGLAPAELEMGYLPRMSFDWSVAPPTATAPPREQLGRTAAQQFASRAAEGVRWARETLLTKQAEYKRQADKRRREVDWEVGDLVYLKKGHWSTGRPSDGLDQPYLGPFRVLSAKGPNAFELDLPPTMKIHRVINASRLLKAPSDPVPGQTYEPPPPVVIQGESEWEIDQVLASRIARGKLQYQPYNTSTTPTPISLALRAATRSGDVT